MTPRELRGWLLCQPRAASLRCVSADQGEHKLAIDPGTSWIKVAETVAALQPELVEALDAKGQLIRAIRPDEVAADEDAEPNVSLSQDPENARIITFAKLLADAYRHSTEVAFDKLAQLFDAVNRRSESLEKSLDAMLRIQRKAIEERLADSLDPDGAGSQSFEQTMIAAMMQGKIQGEVEKAAVAAASSAVKPNGAKTKEPHQ